ncbi:unnamed protein product [Anisakis simplex]|uniref:Coiled-coil domain-containing protein n=1 Tax=Anisakis simplex TaxID=6269 RepID=A0A158PPP9_ANISI|nr:unnamed protein product [Anisakis simplex]
MTRRNAEQDRLQDIQNHAAMLCAAPEMLRQNENRRKMQQSSKLVPIIQNALEMTKQDQRNDELLQNARMVNTSQTEPEATQRNNEQGLLANARLREMLQSALKMTRRQNHDLIEPEHAKEVVKMLKAALNVTKQSQLRRTSSNSGNAMLEMTKSSVQPAVPPKQNSQYQQMNDYLQRYDMQGRTELPNNLSTIPQFIYKWQEESMPILSVASGRTNQTSESRKLQKNPIARQRSVAHMEIVKRNQESSGLRSGVELARMLQAALEMTRQKESQEIFRGNPYVALLLQAALEMTRQNQQPEIIPQSSKLAELLQMALEVTKASNQSPQPEQLSKVTELLQRALDMTRRNAELSRLQEQYSRLVRLLQTALDMSKQNRTEIRAEQKIRNLVPIIQAALEMIRGGQRYLTAPYSVNLGRVYCTAKQKPLRFYSKQNFVPLEGRSRSWNPPEKNAKMMLTSQIPLKKMLQNQHNALPERYQSKLFHDNARVTQSTQLIGHSQKQKSPQRHSEREKWSDGTKQIRHKRDQKQSRDGAKLMEITKGSPKMTNKSNANRHPKQNRKTSQTVQTAIELECRSHNEKLSSNESKTSHPTVNAASGNEQHGRLKRNEKTIIRSQPRTKHQNKRHSHQIRVSQSAPQMTTKNQPRFKMKRDKWTTMRKQRDQQSRSCSQSQKYSYSEPEAYAAYDKEYQAERIARKIHRNKKLQRYQSKSRKNRADDIRRDDYRSAEE